MPSVLIPELKDSHFANILFELHIQRDNIEVPLRERLDDWFSRYEGPLVARRTGRELATLRSAYGSGWTAELFIEHESFENCDIEAPASEREIAELFGFVVGAEISLSTSAAYVVSRNQLPARGIVNQIIGVKTSVSGRNLLLSGARFSMGDSADDSISWFLSRRGEIHGTVVHAMTEMFHPSALSR